MNIHLKKVIFKMGHADGQNGGEGGGGGDGGDSEIHFYY